MIPAYNEENSIARVIQEIPRKIEGISSVRVLVVNDGSNDQTVKVAKEAGADKIVNHSVNRGLASTFRTGLKFAVKMGADVIVNTDADFQYDQRQIPDLIKPVLERKADMVIGSRFDGYIEYMPSRKKLGNRIATIVTRLVSGYHARDAQSGFRAFSSRLARYMTITSKKTYVQETIIRASRGGYKIVEIPITFRKREGQSRLIKNIWRYAFAVLPEMLYVFTDVLRKRKQTSEAMLHA
jgi:glycosyltransferase involved in cell wall biosynthesis